MLWTPEKQYANGPFDNESQLEAAIAQVSKELFGANRIYLDVKKLIGAKGKSAAAFLRRVRPELRRAVSRWTGEYQYTVDRVIEDMIERCSELDMRYERTEYAVRQDAVVLLAVQTMNYLYEGHHRLVR